MTLVKDPSWFFPILLTMNSDFVRISCMRAIVDPDRNIISESQLYGVSGLVPETHPCTSIVRMGKKMYPENVLERRKNERYKVNSPAYAAIGPDFSRMGHIINISRGGLAFSYISNSGTPVIEEQTCVQISDSMETVCEIPFISVSDTCGDVADPHSSVEIRLHRGCFGKLNRKQLESLIGFLGEKTTFRLF